MSLALLWETDFFFPGRSRYEDDNVVKIITGGSAPTPVLGDRLTPRGCRHPSPTLCPSIAFSPLRLLFKIKTPAARGSLMFMPQ